MSGYNAENIKTMTTMEGIRKKLAMYAGTAGEGAITQCVKEMVANSVDEALLGYGDKIYITINTKENSIVVMDKGRGIPLEKIEDVFTKLHAGGKFKSEGNSSYTGFNSGTHGAGLKIPTALGRVEVQVQRNGKQITQVFHYETVEKPRLIKVTSSDTYTKIKWIPDEKLPTMSNTKINPNAVQEMLEWLSYTVPKVKYIFSVDGKEIEILPRPGSEYIKNNYNLISPVFSFKETDNVNTIDVSIGYTGKSGEIYFPFLNTVPNDEGGTHLVNFKTTFTRLYNKYFGTDYKGNEIRNGIVVFLNVSTIHEPSFTSQSKNKVDMPQISSSLNELYKEGLEALFATQPFFKELSTIIEKQQKKERAMEKIREMLGEASQANKNGNAALGKLKPALNKKNLELFLIEGDSAGGSLLRERNIYTQSVMPLKGKIINVLKNDIEKVLANEEVKDLIKVIGGFGDNFNAEKCAYDKIIFCLDADPDGAHIQILLLGFFMKFYPQLVQANRVFIGQTPLYVIKNGNKKEFLYTEKEMEKKRSSIPKSAIVSRVKGVGELNPDILANAVLNEKTRILIPISMEDYDSTMQKVEDYLAVDGSVRRKIAEEEYDGD